MKTTTLFFGLLICQFTQAQIKSGVIKYEMVTSLAGAKQVSDKEIPEAILAMIPKEIKKQKQLRFNESRSIYENFIPKKDESKDEEEPQEATGGFMIKSISSGDGAKEKTFTDFIANKQIESKEFFGKEFLITTDTLKKVTWKPSGKQKIILNYPCYEAFYIGDVKGKQDSIKAWYTTAITTKSGPMGFCNLPGMILQLQLGAIITITAIEVTEQELTDKDVEIPNSGKKVTAAEFKEIQDKKLKEMGIEKGKPRVIMHTSTDMQ